MVDDLARLMADVEMYKTIFEHHISLDGFGVVPDAFPGLVSLGLALSFFNRGLSAGYKSESQLYSTYSMKPKDQRTSWQKLTRTGGSLEASLISLERSTYLAHGLRIVNLAFDKEWHCVDPRCMIDGNHTTVKADCRLIGLMVERGVWYLRRAHVDEATFGEEEHRLGIHVGDFWPGRGRPWLPEVFTKGEQKAWYKFGKTRGL